MDRKIVGYGKIVEEQIKKTFITKNVTRETISRKTYKALVLDCGHLIPCNYFTKAPINFTRCMQCERNKL
jgi:aromatic ring-opening dioxygenase LigB subunit